MTAVPAIACAELARHLADDGRFARGLALAARDHTVALMRTGLPFAAAAAVALAEFCVLLHLLLEDES